MAKLANRTARPVTARAIARTKAACGRVVAIGTTVVRALEHARGPAGDGVATQRIDAHGYRTHELGDSVLITQRSAPAIDLAVVP